MNRPTRLTWWILLVICGATEVRAADGDSVSNGTVKLMRDRWGIANVFADTDAGALYGLGWAAAEDRAFQMYLHARNMQGRSAEVRGLVTSERNGATTVEMDRRNRIIGFFRRAQTIAANLDEETRVLLNAYCAGVNAFMRQHPDRRSPMFEKTGLVPELWTPAHCIAVVWNFAIHFTDGGLNDLRTLHAYERAGDRRAISSGATTAIDYGATVQREDVSDEWVEKTWQYVRAKGVKPERAVQAATPSLSHAWVVGKSKSSTGAAILHSDPQLPVNNPSQLYSFHASGATFNVRGAGAAGSPWIIIGFNEHVAWGMTGMARDAADLFLLKTDSDHPRQYQFDGSWYDIKTVSETIHVRGGDSLELERRETHLGPLVKSIAADVRDGEEVVLIRVPICLDDRETIQACWPMFRAQNVAELDEAMEKWLFPPANMVMGDSRGDIAYRSLGALPLRSPHSAWEGRTAQRGWKSEYLWQEYVPHELVAHCRNPPRGYLSSANQRSIASFYPIPSGLTYGGFGGRGRRLYERMEAKKQFTPEDVLDVHLDTVNVVKRDVVRLGYHLRDVQHAKLSEPAVKALKHLESWHEAGSGMDNRIPGTALMKMMPWVFGSQLQALTTTYASDEYRSAGSDLGVWFDMIFARLRADKSARLNDAETAFIDTILANAWDKAIRTYGRDPSEWQNAAVEKFRERRLQYYLDLDGFPSLDPAFDLPEPDLYDNERLTLLSQQGQSYSQSVSLHDPDSALTLEPIGPSERPASPYRLSTYQLWAEGKFHPAPLSRDAVQKIATQEIDLSDEYRGSR